ncbi:MAG: hypothetical protein ACXIVG_00275, partial [Pararhodobacter sp.]
MMQPYDAFLSDIAREQEIGTIFFLGIDLEDPASLLAQPARHLALALPAPMIPATLRKQAKAVDRLSLHPFLVGPERGQAQLTMYNFTALSSTRPPSGTLRDLFPNLRTARQIAVETRPLDQVRAALPPTEGTADVLIVDLRGEEQVIAAALQAMAPGDRFAHVILRSGQEALYDGAQPMTRLAAQLGEAGYGIAGRNLDDPDIPCVHFRLDPRALRMVELKDALAQKDTELTAAAEARKALEAERAQERDGRKAAEARVVELKNTLAQKDTELAAAAEAGKALEAERAQERDGRKAAEARVVELKDALAQKDTELAAAAEAGKALEAERAQERDGRKAAEA